MPSQMPSLTLVPPWVILTVMQRSKTVLLAIIVSMTLACSAIANLPFMQPRTTDEPVVVLTTSAPTPTETLSPSPTPEPTSTPLPAMRIASGEKATLNGDWEEALEQYETVLQ